MRHAIATVVVVLTWVIAAAGGCSSKPPRDVDAAVRNRLTRYSEAWKQGDAAGVRESFVARDADQAALLDALAELAPAQMKLRTAYYESLGPTGRIIFGDGDVHALVPGSRQWDAYARSAADPHALVYKKPLVLVQLDENDKETIVSARNVVGGGGGGAGWKLELDGFLHGRDATGLAESMQRQVRHTNELTAAVRTGDTKEIQRVMLRQITDVPASQQEVIAKLLAATRPATGGGGTGGAKENPP